MEDLTAGKKRKYVYTILERPNSKPYFMKIGIAFINRDQSLNIFLDALPFDRKLHVRDDEPRPERAPGSYDRSSLPANGERMPLPALPSFDVGSIQ